jgi:hypothetical protein
MDDRPVDQDAQGFARFFTVEEANAHLPELTPYLLRLKREKEQFDQLRRTLDAITPAMRGNGHGAVAVDYEQRIHELVARMSDGVREIAGLGVEVKDLNQGLIDFPHWRDGRVVYLCWRLGEGRIGYWHDIEAGFAGRQELESGADFFGPSNSLDH